MKPAFLKNADFDAINEKISGSAEILPEIRRAALGPLAFFTFSNVFKLAALEKSLHSDFPATGGTKEFLGSAGCTRVFTGLTHGYTPWLQAAQTANID
jgi:hypothetical protein